MTAPVQPTEPLPADVQTEIDRLQGLIKTAYELSPHEDDDDYNYGWADWRKDASIEAKNWKSAFDSLRERIKELEAAAPVQPTEPEWEPIQANVTCPVCQTGLGARWLTQDDVEPPVQPTEPPLPEAADEIIKRFRVETEAGEVSTRTALEVLALVRNLAHPPVQPTEPRESDPIAGISKRLDAALRSKG